MRTSMRLFCAAVLIAPIAFAASEPCVKPGETVNVEFENPDISAFGPGAKIGKAGGFEQDPLSDDPLGNFPHESGTTSVPVSNDGDNLIAGSEVGDGDTGDDCFEIYVVWEVNYFTTVTHTLELGGGLFGLSTTFSQIVPARATIRSHVADVCPC